MFKCIDSVQQFEFKRICLDGGGTTNHHTFSPNGEKQAAFSDVGGTRYWDGAQWRNTVTSGSNAGRQVAGGVILDDCTIIQLVGNGSTAGQLQEIDPIAGLSNVHVSGLHVRANSPSVGDAGPRTRPVGYVVSYDPVNDIVYYATEAGLGRYNRSTGIDDGIIALPGESIRAIGHYNHGHLNSPSYLLLATRTMGLVRVDNPASATPTVTTLISTPSRFEDVAIVDEAAGSFVAVGPGGVFYYDGTTAVDITPSLAVGTGANGQSTVWASVAAIDGRVAVGSINPDAGEWIYGTQDVTTEDGSTWYNGTPTPAVQTKGSMYFSPPNRVLGQSAASGPNLTGIWSLSFNPAGAGEELIASGPLSLYKSQNFDSASPAWCTHNQGASVLSISSVHIDSEGYGYWTGADHNIYTASPADILAGNEPTELSVTGIRDGWSVFSIGTGADKLVLFAPADDNNATNPLNNVFYSRGTGMVTSWSSTDYDVTLSGRPGGLFGWDNGNGTYTVVGWSDAEGYVRSIYTLATDSFSPWVQANSGPIGNTGNTNQERQITGASDGSVLFGIHLDDGQLYRSTDQGLNWLPIATGLGTNAAARTGRMAYDSATDTLVYSDGNGVYRISQASTTATVTQISGINGGAQMSIGVDGCIYIHERSGDLVNLYRFDDIASATSSADGVQIATFDYRSAAGDLVNTMTIGMVNGQQVGINGLQGGGSLCWIVPDKDLGIEA